MCDTRNKSSLLFSFFQGVARVDRKCLIEEVNMYPALNLRPDRIRQKLASGQMPGQIAMTFVSKTVTWEINNKIPDTLENFVGDLQHNLILTQAERFDLIEHIAHNDSITVLNKLCVCLEKKSDDDIIEFIAVLEKTPSLTHLGQFLRSVLQKCQEETDHEDKVQGRKKALYTCTLNHRIPCRDKTSLM